MNVHVDVTKLLALGTLLVSVLYTQIAVSAEAVAPEFPKAESSSATPVESDNFVSDGSPYQDKEIGISITPPKGWEVQKKSLGMSLVLQEPAQDTSKLEPGKTIYQRNITVLTMHEAAPIDEKEASVVKEKLAKDFGGAPGVSDFRVLDEHKFFNFKGKNDGLIVYTTFTSNETPMAQMHVLVSGSERRFLMTYTDLAVEFEKNAEAFQNAWKTMSMIEVVGEAPVRYKDLKLYGAIGAGCLMMVSLLLFMRRKSGKYRFEADEEMEMTSVRTSDSHVSSIKDISPKNAKHATLSDLAPLSDVQGFDEFVFSDAQPLSNVSSMG